MRREAVPEMPAIPPAAVQSAGEAAEPRSRAGLPCIAVFSSLFPSTAEPTAGLFIRERMFRVAAHGPMVVVSPRPWFPLQSLIQLVKPGYRPLPPLREVQQGITVLFPRFLALPGLLRRLDSLSMALCTYPLMRRLRRERGVALIDAHFAVPCGRAAVYLGRWLGLPVSVTLRGTEARQLRAPVMRRQVLDAVRGAAQVFSVSDSLRRLVEAEGGAPERIEVVGNGVDLEKFRPISRTEARRELGLPEDAQVLVSVGGLVERKGFHRVIELLPALVARFPGLHYVVVGGASPEGDMSAALRAQVRELGLEARVCFTGPLPPERIHLPLSAADVFVLATRNEGWANVFLEAMACGLPVVTTAVGGNAEVVCAPELGRVVPFGDAEAMRAAIADALERDWDRARIIAYARENTWDRRIAVLLSHFRRMAARSADARGGAA